MATLRKSVCLWGTAPDIARQSQSAKFRFPDPRDGEAGAEAAVNDLSGMRRRTSVAAATTLGGGNDQSFLRILRQKPLVVASGTVEAATAHITAVAARLKLVNQAL